MPERRCPVPACMAARVGSDQCLRALWLASAATLARTRSSRWLSGACLVVAAAPHLWLPANCHQPLPSTASSSPTQRPSPTTPAHSAWRGLIPSTTQLHMVLPPWIHGARASTRVDAPLLASSLSPVVLHQRHLNVQQLVQIHRHQPSVASLAVGVGLCPTPPCSLASFPPATHRSH